MHVLDGIIEVKVFPPIEHIVVVINPLIASGKKECLFKASHIAIFPKNWGDQHQE